MALNVVNNVHIKTGYWCSVFRMEEQEELNKAFNKYRIKYKQKDSPDIQIRETWIL